MNIFTQFADWFASLPAQFRMMRWTDVLDILLLACAFFVIYRFVRERRGGRLIIGIFAVLLLLGVSLFLQLHAISYILQSLFQVGFIAILILFQPEIRSALERISDKPFRFTRRIRSQREKDVEEVEQMVKEICDAASDLSRNRTGALIVIERATKLGDIILSGVHVDAEVSTYLLQNIFFKEAPLHDGAVVVRENRICAAGCFLPLTEQTDVDPNLGTRHRAALGISENSDAVTIVVSEETGSVSLAFNRKLITDYTYPSLQRQLIALLTDPDKKPDRKKGGK